MVQVSAHWAITALSVATLPSRSVEPCQHGMAGSTPSRRPSVTVLLRQMSAALRAARSVHISGTIRQGAKTLSLNVGITRSGEFSGTISENGAVLTVLARHGHSYLKLSAAVLRIAHLPATACSRFCGKYLELPALQSHQLLAGLNMASMTHSLLTAPAGKVKYLGPEPILGYPTWLVQDSHGNSIYVAAHGKPYVLRE